MKPLLQNTILKSVKVIATFSTPSQTLEMKDKIALNQRFHLGEFAKLKAVYRAAMLTARNVGATNVTGLQLKIVYVDPSNLSKETKVTLTPRGVMFDLTHLNPVEE